MIKIAFIGAGSTVFAKNVLGDCIATPSIENMFIALHDIDPVRLDDSQKMLENILRSSGRTRRLPTCPETHTAWDFWKPRAF